MLFILCIVLFVKFSGQKKKYDYFMGANRRPSANLEMKIQDYYETSKRIEEKYVPMFEAPEAKVLIVDDNRMNLMVTSKLLEGCKVQIDKATSGEECLKMTRKNHYHVILLDYMMPDMDGIETLMAFRNTEKNRKTPAVALTANAILGENY